MKESTCEWEKEEERERERESLAVYYGTTHEKYYSTTQSVCGKNADIKNACDQNADNKNAYNQNAYHKNAYELKCL